LVSDGAQAMVFLGRAGEHANAPRQENPELKVIPVVILTTSSAEEYVLRGYQLHAKCYITKPVGLDGFLKVVRSIASFWLSVVKLPQQGQAV
jgi:DNA-binding NarL/FixJ family response regulator